MNKKDISEYKRRYDISRHHAWAGSILLSVLLAFRIFLEISRISIIPDYIILPVGLVLIIYTLVSLFYAYKYRSGLSSEQKVIQVQSFSKEFEKEKIRSEVEKERLKIEKKKAKAEAKSKKKVAKK
jgi:hypothetical protein